MGNSRRSDRARRLAAACVLALATGLSAAHAQPVAGQVVDSRTKRPVSGVNVAMHVDSTNWLLDSTTTDRIGAFYLNVRPTVAFRLRFSRMWTGTWDTPPITLGDTDTYERQFLVPVTVSLSYSEEQVTKPVRLNRQSSGPSYPVQERPYGTEGRVVADFVVDTLGNVEMSTVTLSQWSRWAFRQAVMDWLPRARFLPAEIDGVRVRQRVQQPYVFNLRR